jgi:hypothetical protein
MKLETFYRNVVETAIANDPRGRKAVERDLEDAKKTFDELKDKDRPYFDEDTLWNPYGDTRLLHGDPETEVACFMVGIDMETPELLLADRLREKGRSIDLVLAHHPEGMGLNGLPAVMALQIDLFAELGVPLHAAEGLMLDRMKEIGRKLMPGNQWRPVDAARLLDIPYACFHTVADNMVATYLQNRLDKAAPRRLEDVVDLLMEQPEYRQGKKEGAGPTVLVGAEKRRAGKIVVDMTGGTGGHKNLIGELADKGVDTLVCMHLGDEHRKQAESRHLNVVIAGHIASDTLGLNLLFDAVLTDDMDLIAASGFRRVRRK